MLASFLNSSNFWTNYADAWIWIVGGVVGALGFIVNQHRKVLKKAVHDELGEELDKDFIKKIAKEVSEVRKETKNNGGSSLRDAIDRIEAAQVRTEAKLDAVKTDLDRHLGYHEGLSA